MRSLLSSSPCRISGISAALALLAMMPAHGAMTLTVDTNLKTFVWSGTATSNAIVVMESTFMAIRLGMGDWNGGSTSGTGANSVVATLNTVSGSGVTLMSGFGAGEFVIAGGQNSFYTDLGFIQKFSGGGLPGDGPATVSMTITGDGQSYSYAGFLPNNMAYLESLDGTDLFFQNNQGGLGVVNIGSAAGEIVVIPEPSSALLLLAAPLVILRRKRRESV